MPWWLWIAVGCGWWSGRNTAGGDPDLERLLSTCATSGWQVRLYEGDGGATTAYWSTVTAERPGLAERQVYFAYAEPLIDALACAEDRVELCSAGATAATLRVDQLGALRAAPISVWRGEPR